MTNTQTTDKLSAFQKIDGTGTIHLGSVSAGGTASTFCTGRHLSWHFASTAEVTCKSCLKKAKANGIELSPVCAICGVDIDPDGPMARTIRGADAHAGCARAELAEAARPGSWFER